MADVVVVPSERTLMGLNRVNGEKLWQRDLSDGYTFTISGRLVVVQQADKGPLEVLDPATGTTRWTVDHGVEAAVYQDVVYLTECGKKTDQQPARCSATARDVRDGRQLWTVGGVTGVGEDSIGTRKPDAPAAGSYVVARVSPGARLPKALDVLIDSETGKVLPGRAQAVGWYTFALGPFLVVTGHDPASGDRECTVTVTVTDARSGKEKHVDGVFSGRREDGECNKTLTHRTTGLIAVGTGSRVAAATAGNRPQVIDLVSGKADWVGTEPGIPIDGDERSVLVREYADAGELKLLDFASGEVRWSAPDPGLSGQSASWETAVTDRLVAVSGASGDRPFVLVYGVDGGRELGRYPGWLAGAGKDWIAVTHGNQGAGRLVLDFIEF